MSDTPRPLAGARVLLGRERARDPLAGPLEAAGAGVTRLALTVTVPGDAGALARASRDLRDGRYDWLVVTSARTLAFLDATGLPASVRTAAVGASTARALAKATGRAVDVVGTADAEALLGRLASPGPGAGVRPGDAVLLPASALARPVLAEGLAVLGAQVTRLDAYSTATASAASVPAGIRQAWAEGAFDAVVLTAASGVRAAEALLGPLPEPGCVVVLGQPSARAVRASDLLTPGGPMAADAGHVPGARLLIAPSPDGPGVLAAVSDAVGTRPDDPPGGPRGSRPQEPPGGRSRPGS